MTPRTASHFLTIGLATLLLAAAGCKSTPNTPATIVDMNNGPDPAAANLAPVPAGTQASTGYPRQSQPARVLGQRSVAPPQQYSETYPTQPYDESQNYDPSDGYDDGQYEAQVDAGQQALYAEEAPPPLPEYQQPELTVANDQWTPGYWNYAPQGYYWVPGAWVAPPYQGALWTPPYWGYEGRRYHFHRGFWALHIGFYGGIPYGHGYTGSGYEGGYWNRGSFFYNRAVQRVNIVNVRNVYERNVTVINNNVTVNRTVSYNGGPGGWRTQPRPAELAVYNERRTPPMQTQLLRVRDARADQQQFFSANRGRPAVAVLTQHAEADRTPQPALRQIDTTRNGFGQQQRQIIQQPNQQQRQENLQQLNAQRQQQNQQRLQQNDQRLQQNDQRLQQNDQRQQQNDQRQQQNLQRQQQLQQREQTTATRAAESNNAVRQQQLENRQVQQQQRQQQLQQNGQRQQQREQQLQQNAQRQQQVQQQMQERQRPGLDRQQQNLNRQPQQQEPRQQNPQPEREPQPRTQPQPQQQNQPQQPRPQNQGQPHQGPGGGGGHPGPQPHGEHGPGH